IGRGYYQIEDCRDGTTEVSGIDGVSVSIYDPFTSIVGTPIYQVGESFTELPLSVTKSSAINGQTLQYPNDQKIESNLIYFQYPNLIKATGSTIDLTTYFAANDIIAIYNAVYGVLDVALSGEIMVTSSGSVIIESTTNIANENTFKGLLLTGALVNISTTSGDPP
ncbi:TPA: hypothetical protein VAM22_003828, partial [Acinetobacter baumannii]|nr:hypothetical protein [Acinetobacter baumannii]